MSVRLYLRWSVCPSVHKKFLWFGKSYKMKQSIFTDHSHSGHTCTSAKTHANIQICIIAGNGSAWSETTAGRCYCETDSESLACMNIPTRGWRSWKQYPAQKNTHKKFLKVNCSKVNDYLLINDNNLQSLRSCQQLFQFQKVTGH